MSYHSLQAISLYNFIYIIIDRILGIACSAKDKYLTIERTGLKALYKPKTLFLLEIRTGFFITYSISICRKTVVFYIVCRSLENVLSLNCCSICSISFVFSTIFCVNIFNCSIAAATSVSAASFCCKANCFWCFDFTRC